MEPREINEDGHLKKINEKPKFDFLINTGLYVLEPSVLELIQNNTFYHITSLMELVIEKNQKLEFTQLTMKNGLILVNGQNTEKQ